MCLFLRNRCSHSHEGNVTAMHQLVLLRFWYKRCKSGVIHAAPQQLSSLPNVRAVLASELRMNGVSHTYTHCMATTAGERISAQRNKTEERILRSRIEKDRELHTQQKKQIPQTKKPPINIVVYLDAPVQSGRTRRVFRKTERAPIIRTEDDTKASKETICAALIQREVRSRDRSTHWAELESSSGSSATRQTDVVSTHALRQHLICNYGKFMASILVVPDNVSPETLISSVQHNMTSNQFS